MSYHHLMLQKNIGHLLVAFGFMGEDFVPNTKPSMTAMKQTAVNKTIGNKNFFFPYQ